jgi:hypothetical protein
LRARVHACVRFGPARATAAVVCVQQTAEVAKFVQPDAPAPSCSYMNMHVCANHRFDWNRTLCNVLFCHRSDSTPCLARVVVMLACDARVCASDLHSRFDPSQPLFPTAAAAPCLYPPGDYIYEVRPCFFHMYACADRMIVLLQLCADFDAVMRWLYRRSWARPRTPAVRTSAASSDIHIY